MNLKRLTSEVDKRLIRMGAELRCPGCLENLGKPGEFFGSGNTRKCPNCDLILERDDNSFAGAVGKGYAKRPGSK